MGIISDKKLAKVESKIDDITKLLNSDITRKADQYDILKKYISNLKFNVIIEKKINDLGEYDYVITYTMPNVVLRFDENGEPLENETFVAFNMLNLISYEDMAKFSKIISDERKKKRKK